MGRAFILLERTVERALFGAEENRAEASPRPRDQDVFGHVVIEFRVVAILH